MKKSFALFTILIILSWMAAVAVASETEIPAPGVAEEGAVGEMVHGEPVHAEAHGETAAAHGEATHGEAAHGEEHGGGHGGGHHGAAFSWGQFIAGLINFAIFLWILVKFAGKGIQAYYKNRAETEMAAVKEAQANLAEARELFEKFVSRKATLQDETSKMVADATSRAKAQAEELLAAAKEQAAKLLEDAKATVQVELEDARRQLRKDLVEDAIEVARGEFGKKLKAKGQKTLVEQFMTKMEDLQ